MEKQIIWSDNAADDLYSILSYLETEWSFKVADNFSRLVEKRIGLLSHFPEIDISSEKILPSER